MYFITQALWKTLRSPVDNIAQVAFRVLGKFGGGNRKMLREPQKVRMQIRMGSCKASSNVNSNFVSRQKFDCDDVSLLSSTTMTARQQGLVSLSMCRTARPPSPSLQRRLSRLNTSLIDFYCVIQNQSSLILLHSL